VYFLKNLVKKASNSNMYNEIYEQPKIIEQSLQRAKEQYNEFYDLLKTSNFKLNIFASGSSYHSGIAGGIALSKPLNQVVYVEHASEFPFRHSSKINQPQVHIAISQSGESGDVIRTAKLIKKKDQKLVTITNIENSTLDQLGDISIITPAGQEKAIAATKSYTSALAILLQWAYQLRESLKNTDGFQSSSIKNIFYIMKNVLKEIETNVIELTSVIHDKNVCYFLGMGSNYATALEGAMKLKETGNVFAEGFGFRQFMHGHIQVVSEMTPIFIILSGEENRILINDGIKHLLNFNVPLYVISQDIEMIEEVKNDIDKNLILIKHYVDPLISPLTLILPLQLLACYNSIKRGLNPDKPEKLSKITL
jgi:glucosamine--fructose-6-phosphate aminotransferase (isomerizing)